MTNTGELEILYRDEHFVAVNKPAGLLVHRSPIDKREKNFAVQKVRDQIGQQVFPVHRLDRPTSGVLVFALNPETAKKNRSIVSTRPYPEKYIAVVRGYVPEQGTIDHPLKEIKDRYIRRRNDLIGKTYPAVTDFKQLATIELCVAVDKYPTSRYSLVELIPKTGRRHQLRRHMKHLSHPIIGDTRHGKTVHNKFFLDQLNCKRLLLTAVEIKFVHPVTGADVIITAAPDGEFSSILNQFNWNIDDFDDQTSGGLQVPDPEYLIKLAHAIMPFGKYAGIRLVDLPEPYVVWFAQKGFPKGELGEMLQNIYEIKVNGLEYLFKPLIKE